MRADAHQAISDAAQRVRDRGVSCLTAVVDGTSFRTICDYARTHRIDLTLMGSHDGAALSLDLLGNAAEKVDRLAPCSVLLVRRKGKNT